MLKQLISEKIFKAIIYNGYRRLSIKNFSFTFSDLDYPRIISGEEICLPSDKKKLENFVFIKVEGCGICGTDVHMYNGKRFLNERADFKNPIIPGHEIFGKVIWAEKKFDRLLNKNVVIDPIMDCYTDKKCDYCKRNKNYMHTPFTEMGICGSIPGGFTEYTIALGQNCYIAENLNYVQKALIEPLATVIYAIKYVMRLSSVKSSFLILGAGCIGLLALQYLKKINPDNFVVILDKNNYRLNIAEKLGADKVICVKSSDYQFAEKLNLLTKEGQGFDYILELSGSDNLINLIPKVSKRLANVLLYGLGHNKVTIDNFDLIIEKELRIYSSLGASDKRSFKHAIKIIKELNTENIITHRYSGLFEIEKALKKDYYKNKYIKGVLII